MPPPKKAKRDRDVDSDEELDKEELKEMLKTSLDEKAGMVAEMEELKEEMDELRQESEKRLLNSVFLGIRPLVLGEEDCVVYLNFKVAEQARAANLTHQLHINGASSFDDQRVFGKAGMGFMLADSCSKVVDVFNNGLKAGDVVNSEIGVWGDRVFRLVVLGPVGGVSLIPAGSESEYLVVGAVSHSSRFNTVFSRELEQQSTMGRLMRDAQVTEWRERNSQLRSKAQLYPQSVQDKLKDIEYNTVLKQVMVPHKKDGGLPTFISVDLDFDRMLEVRADGTTVEIGFVDPTLDEGDEEEEE